MKYELKYKNISIGIEPSIAGIGLGFLFNKDSRILALTFFSFFIILVIPNLRRRKIITAKMITNTSLKLDDDDYYDKDNKSGKYFNIKPHPTFNPKTLYIRSRDTSIIHAVHRFKIIEDEKGFEGVLAYKMTMAIPTFYRTDEYYFVEPLQIVKGYIDNKTGYFMLLSIVD